MQLYIKRILISILLILSFSCMTGCFEETIEVGFSFDFFGKRYPYMGAKFKAGQQDIDDVNLELYIGLYEDNDFLNIYQIMRIMNSLDLDYILHRVLMLKLISYLTIIRI